MPAIEWLEEVDSSNAELLRRAPNLGERHALVARRQTGGRGRQGRRWLSPTGNLYLSLFARLPRPLVGLGGFSLALGIALCRMLRQQGLPTVELKWPNDLQVDGRKLGGLLVEIAEHGAGRCALVVGLGLNLAMPGDLASDNAPDQPWIDLQQCGLDPTVEPWAERCVVTLNDAIDAFMRDGFGAWLADWAEFDALHGRPVMVERGSVERGAVGRGLWKADSALLGIADGIDADGALRVLTDGQTMLVHSGDVRVRAA